MRWQGGIDEAGYGAILGPLSHGGVASLTSFDWLAEFTRHNIKIGDSKVIYRGGDGIAALETAALFAARLGGWEGDDMMSLLTLLCGNEVRSHPFMPYCDANCIALPLFAKSLPSCSARARSFRPYARLTSPAHFNLLLKRGNKSDVAMARLYGLLKRMLQNFGDNGAIVVDKQGGRNSYLPYLMPRFKGEMIMISNQGAELSSYNIANRLEVSFAVRADSLSPLVSLASMIAKYLREVHMLYYNQFWKARVPELIQTAGYPQDGRRFLSQIEPLLESQGMAMSSILRAK